MEVDGAGAQETVTARLTLCVVLCRCLHVLLFNLHFAQIIYTSSRGARLACISLAIFRQAILAVLSSRNLALSGINECVISR
jgi:hypothetical protein